MARTRSASAHRKVPYAALELVAERGTRMNCTEDPFSIQAIPGPTWLPYLQTAGESRHTATNHAPALRLSIAFVLFMSSVKHQNRKHIAMLRRNAGA